MSQKFNTETLQALVQQHMGESCRIGCNGGEDCRCALLTAAISAHIQPMAHFGHSPILMDDFDIEVSMIVANTMAAPQTPAQAIEVYNRIQRAKKLRDEHKLGDASHEKRLLDSERAWMEKMHQLAGHTTDEIEDLRRLVCKLCEFATSQNFQLPEFYQQSLERVWLRSWSNTNREGFKKLLLIEGKDHQSKGD